MLGAGIGHELEGRALRLQRAHHRGGIDEQHVVVGHAVREQQRRLQAFQPRQHAAQAIAFGVVLRMVEIALGVEGVVQAPVGHRRHRRAGRDLVGGLGQQHQGHVAAVAPAVGADARRIDPGLLLQPGDAGELVLDLDLAHLAEDRVLEGLSTTRHAAVVEAEHHVAALRHPLGEIEVVGVGDDLPMRAAVVEDQHRMALRRIEARRLGHLEVQRLPVAGLDRAEFLCAMVGVVGPVGMAFLEFVGLEHRQHAPVGTPQADRGQALARGVRVDEHARVVAEHHGVGAVLARDAARLAFAVERIGVDVALLGVRPRRAGMDHAALRIQRQHPVDRPWRGRDRMQQRAIERVQVKLRQARAFGAPDEGLARLQEPQVVVEVDPGVGGFGQQRALRAIARVVQHEVEPPLVAGHALEGEALAVRQPVDPHEVDVGILAQRHDLRRARGLGLGRGDLDVDQRGDFQGDAHVGLAGGRIALLDHLGAIGVELEAPVDRHPGFVVAGVGQGRVVRRPPVAGVAVHLLLGHELGHAAGDGAAALDRDRHGATGRELDHPQVLLAHEGHVAAARRDLGIGDEALAVRELAHGLAAGLAQVVQVQLAIERKQELLAVGRELVAHDARQRRDALALAPRLLLVGELLGAGREQR